jgi:SAM-dependent methyltransferase
MATILTGIKSIVNRSLAPLGVAINSLDRHDSSDVANFIPFEPTMAAARQAGLSVGDYVDTVMNRMPGSSQNTIDKMATLGMFSGHPDTIVEIGPGTGRYLEKTLKACRPSRYEIYETAGPWSTYLVEKYDVILQPTDGYSLGATPDASADLVHAHKVFSTVPFMVTCCYWQEIARVVRPGGWAAFDVVTERCLDVGSLQSWASSGVRNGSYPAVMPREAALAFFERHSFALASSFVVPMPPGTTELLVFRRQDPSLRS